MQAETAFIGRFNVFTNEEQLIASSLEVGQIAKCTASSIEYRVYDPSYTIGLKIANNNRAIPLSEVVKEFNSSEEMKKCVILTDGDKCRTWGKALMGDTGAAEYIIEAPGVSDTVQGDITLDNGLVAKLIIRDNTSQEKINHIVVLKNTTEVDTGMRNLSSNPKIFVDGLLLIPGENYTIKNNTSGIITLTRPFMRDVNMMIVDSALYSASTESGDRYNTFTLPKSTTNVLCGLVKLSQRPTLIINGLHQILGVHWSIVNAASGEIHVNEPYTEDAECIIMDNVITGAIDATTVSGMTSDQLFNKADTIDALKKDVSNGVYKDGDVVTVLSPNVHLIKITSEQKGLPLGNNLYGKYQFFDRQYQERTIAELQASTRYEIGDIVEVLGGETYGDGMGAKYIMTASSSSNSVPSSDGIHHWALIPNSNIYGKADKADVETIASSKVDKTQTITAGNGLEGGGSLNGPLTLAVKTLSPALSSTPNGVDLTVIDDLVTGGVKMPASAESVKVLKQLIDTIGTGGVMMLMKKARIMGEGEYLGELPGGGKSIAVGKSLQQPVLYLDGIRMNRNQYSVDLQSGLITLNKPYADYMVIWVVEDEYKPYIKFSFPTLNLLLSSEDMKSRIQLNDVIEIQGSSDSGDGDQRLVKCENTAKLNSVELAPNKYLNEIPNSRPSTKADLGGCTFRGDINFEGGARLQKDGNLFIKTGVPAIRDKWLDAILDNLYDTKVDIGSQYKITPKELGNTETNTDMNNIRTPGLYYSRLENNKWTNIPNDVTGAFELTVTSMDPYNSNPSYATQTIKDYRSSLTYIRTQSTFQGNNWSPWNILWTSETLPGPYYAGYHALTENSDFDTLLTTKYYAVVKVTKENFGFTQSTGYNIYGFGLLRVTRCGVTLTQEYISHIGDFLYRMSFDGGKTWPDTTLYGGNTKGWLIGKRNRNEPRSVFINVNTKSAQVDFDKYDYYILEAVWNNNSNTCIAQGIITRGKVEIGICGTTSSMEYVTLSCGIAYSADNNRLGTITFYRANRSEVTGFNLIGIRREWA